MTGTRTRTITEMCDTCMNLGFETYIKDGEQVHSACPECLDREKGAPIDWSELNGN